VTDHYTASPLPAKTKGANSAEGEEQIFVTGQDLPADWWKLFHCEALNGLVQQALAKSPGVAAAEATLRQARENSKAQDGAVFPQIDLNASDTREKFSAAGFGQALAIPPSIFNLYNASVNISYNLDLFGGTRRAIEGSAAEVEYQSYELKAAHLALVSNLTTTAFKEAALRGQLEATRGMIDAQGKQLSIMEKQLALGGTARADVIAERKQFEQTKETLPPIEKGLEQARNQLAVYAGKLPSESNLPKFQLADFTLPRKLPVSLPSSLVRQRPDIRAAEAKLHEASAEIGVATANLFPQFKISAAYGPETTEAHELFNSHSIVWSLAGSVTQPLFHGGELKAKRRAAKAAYDQAAANYRQTVLQAFQNVADTLKALEADARTLEACAAANTQAKAAWKITKQQNNLGGASNLTLLDARRQYQQTRFDLAQAQAARLADTAALFSALGGGWWNQRGTQ
jgi:NodT family efflux transporter outer membrane factor (OMF) lipoprotein